MRKIVVMMLAAAVGFVAAQAPVTAAPLPPGPAPIAVPIDFPAEGAILKDTGAVPYAFGLVNTGTIQEIVVKDDGVVTAGLSNNPFGAGTLSFIYQVHVTGGQISRVSGASFAGFLTDVIQAAPIAPFSLTGIRTASSADRFLPGAVVGFNFVPTILPDGGTTDTSYELTVRTNAAAFIPGFIGLIDGGGTTIPGYAPAPEPASIIMLGFGAAGMLGYGWKRRKAT